MFGFIKNRCKSGGFTLIDTAIMIGVVSVVLSTGVALYRVQHAQDARNQAKADLEEIRKAMWVYRGTTVDGQVDNPATLDYDESKRNHWPCPAPLGDVPTSTTFGREDTKTVAGRDCKAKDSFMGSSTLRIEGPNHQVIRIGAVPVFDLGLPPERIRDPWGRRYMYAVTEDLADASEATAPKMYDALKGGIKFIDAPVGGKDPALEKIPDFALDGKRPFVLMSFGKDGIGAFTYGGGITTLCQSTTAGTTGQAQNCDYRGDNLDSSLGRYKIISVSNVNPVIIATQSAHSLVTGNIVRLTIPSMAGLDNRYFKVTVLSPTTFSLQNVSTGASIDNTSGALGSFSPPGTALLAPDATFLAWKKKYIASADLLQNVSQSSSTTISGLAALEGKKVVVWANNKDLGSYTVASGKITVSEAVTSATIGTKYTAVDYFSESGDPNEQFDDIVRSHYPDDDAALCGSLGQIYNPTGSVTDTNSCVKDFSIDKNGNILLKGLSLTGELKLKSSTCTDGTACNPTPAGTLCSDSTGAPLYCDGTNWKKM